MNLPISKSKKILFFLFSICLLGYSENSFSQNINQDSQEMISSKNEHYQLMDELEGVYQIQMINTRTKPAIDTDVLKTIKSEQSDNEQVIVNLNDNIRIKILSKSEALSGIKFPENELIIYINE